jgi:hypothetical protein
MRWTCPLDGQSMAWMFVRKKNLSVRRAKYYVDFVGMLSAADTDKNGYVVGG